MKESGVTFIRGECGVLNYIPHGPLVLRDSIALDENAQNGSELMPKGIYGSTPQLRFKVCQ
jgi:hypothetical protein